ncbi:pollen-specific leucine-rich repeat extensin 1 [Labeo rohita]|uniref:Pollen-specific leucine-rich repeat extensin 1 n=1 Tax=Labeo rohita TaxID=84645 RepID=A0A498MSS1_LABRO|nr:pollen-specific leucine-rich repeat extensin 1 [Labeo rohita]
MSNNSSLQEIPMARLFTLGWSVPASSSCKRQVQKGRSQRSRLFQERRGYKPQASLKQREPEPVKLPLRSPVPEGSPQECSSKGAPMLECFSQETPAKTPQEEPALANFPEGEPLLKCSPRGAPMPKLFTVGICIPVLSTKKYRLHKHQASLTHRTRLPVITAEKSPVPESTSLDEARVEAMELYRSSSSKAAKAPKEALMPDCSPQEALMPKLFTLGISVPVLSTKKYRLHKHQVSLTHRTRLPVITAEKSPVPESTSLDEAKEEAIKLYRSSSNKASKALKEEPMPECSPQEGPMPKLFTLGISVPVLSTKNYRLHKHQASLTHRTHLPVINAEKSPVPESTSLDETREEAMELYRSSSDKAAKALKEAPMPDFSPQEAPMTKLFTLGISIPVLSTKNYRLHKHQASLTHRIRLPVINAKKSPVPESTSLDKTREEAMELYRSSSNKAAKAQKEAPMPDCSPQEAPMPECSPEVEPLLVCSPEVEPKLLCSPERMNPCL